MGELHTFACAGNLKGIKKALANKKLLLALDKEKGWSPLHYASHYSKAKIVQVILDAGISPNIKSNPPEGQKQNDWNLALEDNKENKAPDVHRALKRSMNRIEEYERHTVPCRQYY